MSITLSKWSLDHLLARLEEDRREGWGDLSEDVSEEVWAEITTET